MPDLLTEIPYEEIQGSPSEGLNLDGKTATRRIKVAWNLRLQLRTDLLRTTFPGGDENLVCISINSEPFDARNLGADHIAAYDLAILTLQYETVVLEDTETIEPSAEFLTTGVNNLRWESNAGDQVTTEESPGQLFVGFDYIIERKGIKVFPVNVLGLIGKVNDAAINPTAEGLKVLIFPKETLLYNPPSISPRFDGDGNRIWDVVFRLTFKPNFDGPFARGWNEFWRPSASGGGKFQKMFEAGGVQYKPYPTGDFTTI